MNKWEAYSYVDGDGWAKEYLVVGIRNAQTKERICSGVWAGLHEVEQIVKAHNDEIERILIEDRGEHPISRLGEGTL